MPVLSRPSSSPRQLLWINGRVQPLEDGRVSVEDRGFLFADGIYEVIHFYAGRPFGMTEHMERWERSAAGILLEAPGTRADREARIMDLVEASGFGDCYVYGQLTRGAAPRNHVFPNKSEVPATEMWYTIPARTYAPELFENGVRLLSQADERWANCHMKTIALLPNVLAKERARRAGCFEALLWREDGTVTECSASNAFCVRDGVVWTHPLTNRILPGVTRIAVVEAARAVGIELREEAVSLEQFRSADEAFISSTTMEVMPVTVVDGRAIGSGKVGEVTRRLRAATSEFIRERCGLSQAVC